MAADPEEGHRRRVEAAKRSLAAFEWLGAFAEEQVRALYGQGSTVFAEELRVCKNMAEALPQKIARMHYHHVRFRT